jgi:hypothetical protein
MTDIEFHPRCVEAVELAALRERHRELELRVREIDGQQRAAQEAVTQAREALVQPEEAALSGEKVSAQRRAEVERTLTQAQLEAAAPWSERRTAAQRAVADANRAIVFYVGENLTTLLDELREDGEAAAAAVDAAAAAVVDAVQSRAAVEQATFKLLSTIRTTRPGDVQRSRSEGLAKEAGRLLDSGGERAPVVLGQTREPSPVAVEVSA